MSIVLEAVNLSKTYHTTQVAVTALKNCSVRFEQGEFVSIIGKSGSGKSTLLRILGSQDTPDEGDVLINGKSILHLKDAELSRIRRHQIGYVYQDYSLFPEYTAYENIVLPIRFDDRKENAEEVAEIMEMLGIAHCRDKFPEEMSGGEQQRTAIARALAVHPAIILADEPTGNLDAQASSDVVQLLGKAAKVYKQTIIMVTHDRQAAEYSDRILTIRDGVLSQD